MVNKITSAITPNETADKINEIIDDKQDVLVSGTNIKTINSESILGRGDITISGSSLPSQTGNAGKFLTTDGTDASWASISQRNIGEIVTSTIPLTDAGLHLLDGALISGSGSYADFVTYIAGLVSTYPDLFETEANWQTAVTTYGVCGKFVYDSVNNTVRLPKRTSEHGVLIKSYSSGTNWYRIWSDGWCEQGGFSDNIGAVTVSLLKFFNNTDYTIQITHKIISGERFSCGENNAITKTTNSFGAYIPSSSNYKGFYWRVCGYVDISDYQYSPIYEYLVIATSTKTDIQVDIDEIATDLNGKADTDLSNVPTSKGILSESYVNGTSWYRVYSDGWCQQGGELTSVPQNTTVTINLLKPYANTNYSVLIVATGGTRSNTQYMNGESVQSRSVDSFVMKTDDYTFGRIWQACGYIR